MQRGAMSSGIQGGGDSTSTGLDGVSQAVESASSAFSTGREKSKHYKMFVRYLYVQGKKQQKCRICKVWGSCCDAVKESCLLGSDTTLLYRWLPKFGGIMVLWNIMNQKVQQSQCALDINLLKPACYMMHQQV